MADRIEGKAIVDASKKLNTALTELHADIKRTHACLQNAYEATNLFKLRDAGKIISSIATANAKAVDASESLYNFCKKHNAKINATQYENY